MPNVEFRANVTWRNDLLWPAALYGARVPTGLPETSVRAPLYISAAEMQRLSPSRTIRVVAGLTVADFSVRFADMQQQWRTVMGNNPSSFKGPKNPVDGAGWNDCQAFIAKLNEKFRAERAKFALPTEAQWEYACRAGTTTRWSFGDDPAKLDDYAWSEKNGKETTHPVGQKKPNAWGLYDMHGNVCEWCADWYVKDYYAKCPAEDPAGPSSGAARVLRGGAWYCGHDNARSAVRYRFTPGLRYLNVGFRAARTP